MRVAVVYDFFPHYRVAVMRELLASREHDYFLVADEKPMDPSLKAWQVEDRSRFIHAPYRRLAGKLHFQKGLLGLMLRRDFDAVIFMAYPNFLSTWMSALAARLTGKRVLFWTHGWTRSERGPKAWIRCGFYRLADALLLYGHTAKARGLSHGFSAERLHVIYNSLDYEAQKQVRSSIRPEDIADTRARLFERPEWPVVICSARLTRSCRLDLLLEAQLRLCAENHPFNIILVGDGPERPALESRARQARLPVHFHGACYDEKVLATLTMAAHVTVSPGKVGLTAMQSLAYGVPVITHDDMEAQGPEVEAIFPGRTGDLFRRNDVTDLARSIRQWTQRDPGSDLRAECHRLLECPYNPTFQRRAIDRAVSGLPADDLFGMTREEAA